MHHSGLRAVTQATEEGGDAVCPPETHFEARSTEASRHKRGARRVLDGCSGSESAKNGSVAHAGNCMKRPDAPRAPELKPKSIGPLASSHSARGRLPSFSTESGSRAVVHPDPLPANGSVRTWCGAAVGRPPYAGSTASERCCIYGGVESRESVRLIRRRPSRVTSGQRLLRHEPRFAA